MNQEVYAAHMRAYAPSENARMRAGLREEHRHAGGDPSRPPLKLLQAAKTLRQKGFLTASDLGTILKIPPVMTTVQLVSTLATILSNYCDADDAETMDQVTRAAIDAIMECESAAMLDLSVGPEDGIN